MRVTPHAAQRWVERFPDLDLHVVFAGPMQRVGKKTRARIRRACPGHDAFMRGEFKGRYYLMTPDRIVFAMAPPETVLTVFKLVDAADNNKVSLPQ